MKLEQSLLKGFLRKFSEIFFQQNFGQKGKNINMRKILYFIGAVLGVVCGYISLSILGWISLFFPQKSDELLEKLQKWANNGE